MRQSLGSPPTMPCSAGWSRPDSAVRRTPLAAEQMADIGAAVVVQAETSAALIWRMGLVGWHTACCQAEEPQHGLRPMTSGSTPFAQRSRMSCRQSIWTTTIVSLHHSVLS
eukprot:915486-Rhodomonas_salina.1